MVQTKSLIVASALASCSAFLGPRAVAPAAPTHLAASRQEPHGGKLVNLFTDDVDAAIASCDAEVQLSERQSCDVELLCNGGFSPLTGFMDEAQYGGVVEDMALPGSGLIFSLPVVFDTDDDALGVGSKVLLKQGNLPVAVLDVESKYAPDKPLECKKLYGTSSLEHPGCQMVAMERGKYYLGGKVTGLNVPVRDFPCETPVEVRARLPEGDVVAFQCRNPVHRAHYELFTRALDAPNVADGGVVLVHPTCGPTQPGDISGVVRYKTYEVLKEETANDRTFWAYLPYSMHMAGPREALHHMMIRKNFGCTHFIIGRDMAGCKSSIDGEDFYGAYDAQDFAIANGPKIGMTAVPSLNLVYTAEKGYMSADDAKAEGLDSLNLSGTKFRKMLRGGEDIPEWFAFKSVVEVLRQNA